MLLGDVHGKSQISRQTDIEVLVHDVTCVAFDGGGWVLLKEND
jgi:hypothetical protein